MKYPVVALRHRTGLEGPSLTELQPLRSLPSWKMKTTLNGIDLYRRKICTG